jgi:hypothetical protein
MEAGTLSRGATPKRVPQIILDNRTLGDNWGWNEYELP